MIAVFVAELKRLHARQPPQEADWTDARLPLAVAAPRARHRRRRRRWRGRRRRVKSGGGSATSNAITSFESAVIRCWPRGPGDGCAEHAGSV